jgi:amino acid adenylation domain-containing protein/non-ribosomal peptide synthase protein (TIGR01720 family)
MRLPYVHEMFARVAERHPDLIAVESIHERLTYRELHDKSNLLAASAAAAGVARNDLVVIFAEDRRFIVESILAVLKAGAAFVPLSPAVPRKRLDTMLAQCSPRWAIVEPKLAQEFQAVSGAFSISVISTETSAAGNGFVHGLVHPEDLDPDGLAYIFFTSGSTGKPKAIAGRLKAIDHFIRWEIETLGVATGSRVSQLMSPVFDAFMRDMFVPLCSGGTICIPEEDGGAPDGAKLARWIGEAGINLVHTVPSVFRLILNQTRVAPQWSSVRHVLLSGEPLLPTDVKRWHELVGNDGGRLVNLYGPTETTMTKFVYMVQPEDQFKRSISIGQPMKGAKAIVLDKNGKACPPWRAGELYIRTPYRSLGYFGQPELTSEVFVQNPFSNDPTDLVYRTGDLARVVDQGNFELLGRRDNQVKIRGVRIEMEEIEAALGECDGVSQAALAVREETPGEKRLAAFVVAKAGARVTAGSLRAAMKEKLPEYMVPSVWGLLEKLPLTASGKVDRQALEKLEPGSMLNGHGEAGEASTQTEEILCGIWSQLLKVSSAGVHDNFFELGGHSLLATQVMSRIQDVFRLELPLRFLFESPTPAGLAKCIEQVKQQQAGTDLPPIQSGERPAAIPLSYAQQRFWFIDQLQPGGSSYNVPSAVRVEGALDREVLEKSLKAIVRRHESLRTRFISVSGAPQQVIDDEVQVSLTLVDLASLPSEAREAKAREIIQRTVAEPFDLGNGPLLRARLLSLDEQRHILVVVMHHIISDAWSVGLLEREVSALYGAFISGEPSPLPELPVQYPDFSIWQRKYLDSEFLEKKAEYWKHQLAGLEALELPTDWPRPQLRSENGANIALDLPLDLTGKLKALARRETSTLYMVLLAAFQTLLFRYTGQEDLAVGSPVAGRSRSETERLIGCFINTLVLRADLSGGPKFTQLIQRVKEITLNAFAHQDVPFEKLVEMLQPERNLSRSPLFQALFVLQNAPRSELRFGSAKVTSFDLETRTTKFDLTLILGETASGMAGMLQYNTDLFEAATIGRMAVHFQMLLKSVVSGPEQAVSELDILTEAERRQLLAAGNQAFRPWDQQSCVHALIDQQSARTPDAVAVEHAGKKLLYAELSSCSNQLARHLAGLGVGPETRVGIYMERGAEVLIGLLAVLKAGGAYIPLDPAYPAERIAHMLDDGLVSVVLTREGLAHQVPPFAGRILNLDAEEKAISSQSAAPLENTLSQANLAYIIYTSGSTGKAKGVGVSHENLLVSTLARTHYYRDPVTGYLLLSSFSFDSSVAGIFWTLVQGGALIVPSEDEHGDPAALARLIAHARASHLLALPSLYELVLKAETPLNSLKVAIVAGESCSTEIVALHRKRLPGTLLANEYGPTEATVWCTAWCDDGNELRGRVPVGQPVANARVFVLDRDLGLVPQGVAGELWISGPGLSRGYLGRPHLTAEKFLPNPFSEAPGERLYQTGDLVRWNSGGNLEYLGRRDEQVKLRGFRIELGEIEAALRRHAALKDAAVVLGEVKGDKRLVAYCVPAHSSAPAGHELRRDLLRKLPDYMVPGIFVILEKLPLTPNGKLDRKALAAAKHEAEARQYTEPRDPVEQALCGILENLLGVDRVGIADNFFELGGHSLLATQVMSQVRSIFEVELPLRALFEAPVVSDLAERVRSARGSAGKAAPPLVRVERTSSLPLSYAQQRLWFLDQLDPGNVAYNAPLGVRLQGALDKNALRWSVDEIIRRHEVLRTGFPARNGKPVQEIVPQLSLPIEEIDLSRNEPGLREEEARRLAQAEVERPFDLAHAPLLRARLIKLDEQDHVLLVTMHHIVSDGWSTGIIVREFMQLYEACLRQEQPPLPEPVIQYADFAAWQREWLQGEVLEQQLEYWRDQLARVEPLNLPLDHPRTRALGRKGDLISFQTTSEFADEIRQLARRQGVTVFMTLLAALQVTLSKHAGQQDIAVGTAVANRNRSEIEGLVGFFVNTLVMRTQLDTNWTFAQLLQQVRGVALNAYQHQDVPFEKLVEELQPERDLSRSPLFQVMLVLQNLRRQELQLPGMRLSGFTPAVEAPKFDLMLTMGEGAGGIVSSLSYASDLFERATMERLLEHLKLVLRRMVENPEKRIAETSLLTETERQTTLVEWNQTSVEFAGKCVHEMFEEQAARTPRAIAVKYEQQRLTYKDLDSMADRIAGALRKKGVRPESLVGICLDRSPEMVAALLGTLKSGGAYMPLDPAFPAERLRYMVQDSGASVIVCSAAVLEKLNNIEAEKLKVEDLLSAGDAHGACEKSLVSGGHPAYVIYTSGSTGEPKGAVLTHASLMNHMAWMQRVHPIGPGDPVLQKTVFTFDASVWEFYAPLLAGGTLVMARPGGHQDPEYLVRCVQEEAITILQLVPLQLRFMLEQKGIEHCHSLKRVYCGGEVLSRDLVETFYQRVPSAKLYNLYGPTETTIDATMAECERMADGEAASIGKPVANTQVYVLDDAGEPVPVGCWGELYIGGAGLGRGYLRRAALTAERFVPNPFSASGGERLYRTGDQVRWLADGNLEFMGRLDHQVKFRGHRLELGEIVAALRRHADVEQAVVVVREDRGEKRLVAYVVAKGKEPGRAELRSHLQTLLPEYAVPSDFVLMERLPLLPNGKIDRKALPAPVIGQSESGAYVGPRTRAEEILCDIWAALLNIERVGIYDNFFELGGDSILSIQVIARAREAGLNLTARQIFERQTVAELAELAETAGLAEEFRSPQENWLLDNTQRAELKRIIETGNSIEDVYPLSSMQQGMLFHSLYEPGSKVYLIQLRSYISRGLKPEAFRRAWTEVVRRHAILRTAVLWEGLEKPLQVVYQNVELPWRTEDLRGLGKAEQEEKWLEYLREDQALGFDFQNAPLMRLALLRTGEESYYFAWTFHHILIDGWCRQVLVKEVFSLYEAYCEGKPFELEVPPAYRNYIAWLEQQSESKAEAFWREELKGFTSPTRLGLEQEDIELEPGQEKHGELALALTPELTQQLEHLGRDWRITQNTIVQGAWALLLSRYSGEADVLFGATVSGRSAPVPGIESMMGLFINTLPVRAAIQKDETVAGFFKRLQARQAEVREYEYSPLTRMQAWSEVHGMPLFSTLVVFENYPVDSSLRLRVAKSISIEALDLIDVSNYPLTLIAHPGSELTLSLGYDRTVFTQESAERLLKQLRTILIGVAAGDGKQLRHISLLDEDERRQVLFHHNQTAAAIPEESLQQVFERQAAQEPDAVALEFEGRETTYRELNQRANQIARYLRRHGVEVETVVGISLERSVDMIAGLLGILKAGGAYVPLDAEYPRERLSYMLKDTGVRVLLTQESLSGNLPEFDGQTICLDREWEQISREQKQNPEAAASGGSLAYVIYTSGSTGQPKGVAVEQHAVVRLVKNTNFVQLGPEEVLLHLAPLSFDASTFEIWGALLNGARLVIAPPGTPGLERLGQIIRTRQITTMWLTASLFHLMVAEQPDDLKQVRQLLAGGEALLPGVVRQAMHALKQGNVINGYGPTENTTFTCCYTVTDEKQVRTTVPIGKPIANTQVYVLDEEMEPVPAGMCGELYAGGTGLARGYLNRPELTAEKFVPNPFGKRPGVRLYRTGDRVRLRTDGTIEFVGRQDNQVKVHGFRIELGEIETALEQLADVRQAVVIVREDDAGNKQLVAYVVAGGMATKAQLREALGEKLPQYMVPANFVMLDSLPLSPNGKVDRKALPEPMVERRTDEGYVAPRSRVETLLCGIWAKLLKVDRVGVHDNFFELGGDSILSIQVIGRARDAGIQLTPRQIFERQTIAELVEVAEISEALETASPESWSARPVPLTPIQAAFFQWKLADPSYYNQAVMLELKPGVDSALVKKVLEGLLQHHEILRMKYERHEEGMLQVCSERNPHDFYQYKDFSGLDQESQNMVLELDADRAQASLDLESGRLVCAVEYDLGAGKNKRLLLVIHHLAVDGVSWRILLADLERGYEQLKNGQPLNLSKTASFRRWADWVHEYGGQERLRQEMAYWCADSRRGAKQLPKENAGVQEMAEELETVSVSLDEKETRELLQQVPKVYHTQINDVLLAALGRVCAGLTGSRQVLIDLEGHGREEVLSGMDLSQTVGWFTAIYPVLLEVEENWEPGRALKQTKEQLRQVPNRGFGYGVLRYICEDEKVRRELAGLPQAEISFNYLGQFDQIFRESKLFLPAQESSGRSVSRENRRQHLVDVGGIVVNGRLQIGWTHNPNQVRREAIEKAAQQYLECLRQIIEHCRGEEAGGFTPSDFPLARLNQNQVDRFIGKGTGIEDVYGMSSMQQGLLFHALYEAGSSMHFLQLACHIRGGIVPRAFRRAWEEVVRRHAILRTAFLWEGLEQSVQIVHERVEVPWLEQDWSHLPAAEQRQKWEKFLQEDRRQGFDFRKAPLMRLALLKTGEDSYYFVWSTHHILMDGWCRPLLIGDVFNLFKSYREGKDPGQKRVPAYREYIAWLQRQDESKAEAFWREFLGGFSGSHDLGIRQHKRELLPGQEPFGEKRAGIGRELTEQLEKLAREQQVTLNTVIQGAWALVLAAYTGHSDVIFGTTVSGRPAELPGVENMIGLFINTLPVRVRLNHEERVSDYLLRLQKRQLELRDYEYSPLPKVQSWSDMPRGIRLFESLVVFENYPADTAMEKQVDASMKIESVRNFDVTNYPVSVVAVPAKDMVLVFKYDRTLFAHETIERVFDQLRTVLEQMAASSASRIGDVSLLRAGQQRLLTEAWETVELPPSDARSIPVLVAERALQAPQAPALIAEGRQLSYAELNRRANQLARHLQSLGLAVNLRAAICLEKESNLVVAMLAVLKAGAAFVVIQPDQPAARITDILIDAEARVILTERPTQGLFDELSIAQVSLDADQERIEAQSGDEPAPPVVPGSVACLLYHSSPDGSPRGALVTHTALSSGTFPSALAPGAGDRVANTVDPALEGACFEIFATLVSGGCLVSIPRQSLPPRKLAELLREQRVTVLLMTAAPLARIAAQFPLALKKVRLIVVKDALGNAGPLPQFLAPEMLERAYGVYGFSEGGGAAAIYPLKDFAAQSGVLPVGSLAAGRKLYLLDRQLRPSPEGVVGEIYIGGSGVSPGYEKLPARSAETFVSDPFSPVPGARMYRTGDKARRLPDGRLELEPRTDGRLMVHGQRVEVKEVEAVLAQYPGVSEAAVMHEANGEGNVSLSAVLVTADQKTIPTEELRVHLAKRLPEFMVPASFATVTSIPRTLRGEVDLAALARKLQEGESEEPRNQVEETLASIWTRLLKLERISVHENFFELGGDSILSIQVVTQAQEAGVHITPRQLFERPTIAGLAEVASTQGNTLQQDQGPIIGPVPLTPVQAAFFDWKLVRPSHFNQAVLLELNYGTDSQYLENAVSGLMQQHDSLRMKFVARENGWEQSCEEAPPQEVYQRRDLSRLDEQEQTDAMEQDVNLAHGSLDLEHGPLMRAVEYDLGSARGKRLLLVIHHLVVDGVSWRILLTDLERAYEQLAQGQPLNLGLKTTSYKRWSEELRQHSRREQVVQELSYWCSGPRKNAGVLPRDYPDVLPKEITVETTRNITLSLEAEETRELLQEVPQIYHTQINEVLLAVAGQVFCEWTGSGNVLLDLEGHGREDLWAGVDLSRTVGWFTTLYPVLFSAHPGEPWEPGGSIKQMKEQLRAVPNRGFNYGVLRYVSEDPRIREQMREMPRAQASFNYLGQLDALIGDPRLFKLAAESSGKAAAGENQQPYLVSVNAAVVQGKLQVNWSYSEKLHRRDSIQNVAQRYMECLRDLLAHSRSEEAGGFTPSDFPLAQVTEEELSHIAALLDK